MFQRCQPRPLRVRRSATNRDERQAWRGPVRAAEDSREIARLSCGRRTEDEAATGAQTATANVRNSDRRGGLAASFRASEHPSRRRLPTDANGPLRRPWKDRDPSRTAAGHGSGGFVQRAWYARAVSLGGADGPPFALHDGPPLRRFQRSKSDPDRTVDRQAPDGGSERTRTFYMASHRRVRQCMRAAPHAGTLGLLTAAISALRPPLCRRTTAVWRSASRPPILPGFQASSSFPRAGSRRPCGYVDNARALPTYPQAPQQPTADPT